MSENAAAMMGLKIADRQRFADVRARAAVQGFILVAARSGFVLRREGQLVHRVSLESVVAFLNATEGRR